MGLVLGPEAPLIALGSGLAIFAVKQLKKDTSDQATQVIAASAAFAALASVFGSPVVGAVILIEAVGLGGAMLPLILLPGLLAAGIGSLVLIGLNSWVGLNNSDYALSPLSLPAYTSPTVAEFGWTVVLSFIAALLTYGILRLSHLSAVRVRRHPWVLIPVAAVLVGVIAVVFAAITDMSANAVLFSGETAFDELLDPSSDLALGTLAMLLICKGLAWSLSMGSFRGGPTFPALFVGAVGGLMAADLPGFSETPAVAALMAATAPIVIVSVVVAYITIVSLPARATGDAVPAPTTA